MAGRGDEEDVMVLQEEEDSSSDDEDRASAVRSSACRGQYVPMGDFG